MVSVDRLISEHGCFIKGFPQGATCLGNWSFQEPIWMSDGDWIEQEDLVICPDGILEPLRYRVHRANGDIGEWLEMIPNDE